MREGEGRREREGRSYGGRERRILQGRSEM